MIHKYEVFSFYGDSLRDKTGQSLALMTNTNSVELGRKVGVRYGAAMFDGTNYLSLADANCLQTNIGDGEDFFIELWVHPKRPYAGAYPCFIAKDGYGAGEYCVFFRRDNGDIRVGLDGSLYTLSIPDIRDKLTQLIVYFDRDNRVYAYVDGVYHNDSANISAKEHSTLGNGKTLYIGHSSDLSKVTFPILKVAIHKMGSDKLGTNLMNRIAAQLYDEYQEAIDVGDIGQTKQNFFYPAPTDLSKEDGLVGAWNMENVNGEVLDLSGNGVAGDIHGALDCEGLFGRALRFDGVKDYIQIADDPVFDITTTLSVSVWFKNDDADLVSNQAFVSKYNYTGDKREWMVTIDSIEKIRFIASSLGTLAASDYWVSDAAIVPNLVNHLILIYNAGVVSLWLNGISIPGSWNGAGVNSLHNDTTDVNIGAHKKGLYPWKGIIDGVRIYNSILSTAETKALYNKGSSQVLFQEDFADEGADGLTKIPDGWVAGTGVFKILEDADGKYLQCTSAGTIKYPINLDDVKDNGFIRVCKGTLSGGITYSGGFLTLTFADGDKLYELVITRDAAGYVDPWPQQMVNSYKDLHGTLPDGMETALLDRLKPGGYLYGKFGPFGQNKVVCDFVLGFKFDGNIASRVWDKIGVNPRFDFDGTVTIQEDLPAHTLGAGAGILTVSSTDGWDGLTRLDMGVNNFVSQFPNIWNTGLNSLTYFRIRLNSFTGDLSSWVLPPSLTYFHVGSNLLSGDLSSWVLPSSIVRFYLDYNSFSGNVSKWVLPASILEFYIDGEDGNNNFSGDLSSWTFPSTMTILVVSGNSFTGDLSKWVLPTSLVYFAVHMNNFTGDLSSWVLAATLTNFYVNTNNFTGNLSSWVLPNLLFDIYLYHNNFSGDISGWVLPPSISGFQIHSNNLSGDISGLVFPASLWKFLIDTNNFTGDISSWVLPVALSRLTIASNNLSGNLKNWVLPITLVDLQIYGNNFTGDLNDWNLPATLIRLYLNENGFTVAGAFVTTTLILFWMQNNVLSQAEVDMILADYVAVAGVDGCNLDLSESYVINVAGSNAEPSAQGMVDRATLMGFAWTGDPPIITVTV